MDAAVHGGELNVLACTRLDADLRVSPRCLGVDQGQAGIQVRVRELAPSINASPGYGITRSEVRYETATEARAAEELASILSTGGTRLPLRPVNNATPLYLSVFAC